MTNMASQDRNTTKTDVSHFIAALSKTLTYKDIFEDESKSLGFGSGNAGFDSITISSIIDSFNIYIAVRRGGSKNDIPTGIVGESTSIGEFIDLVQGKL
jgi:hypothetical protein